LRADALACNFSDHRGISQMNIMIGDTIVTDDRDRKIGIVENRSGTLLTVRFPEHGNRREPIQRNEVTPLADLIYQARLEGKRLGLGSAISLAGDSKLADLVELFGYSTGQMRRESLHKVRRQLWRAGLEIMPETDRWSRDDKFKIVVRPESPQDEGSDANEARDESASPKPSTIAVGLPEPFWPTALGLDRRRELEFLRALTESDPILCLLYMPTEAQVQSWIQGAWEGLIGWAFRAGQRFLRAGDSAPENIHVRVGGSALLHTHLKLHVLDGDAQKLEDSPHSLNLITIKRDLELPTDFARLYAVWPGPVFEFKPDYHGEPSADIQSIKQCLALVAGFVPGAESRQSPLVVLNWSTTAYAQLMCNALVNWGKVVSSAEVPKFKGSNETSTSLALKARLADWVRRTNGSATLEFEHSQTDEGDEDVGEETDTRSAHRTNARRIDLHVEGMGDFEVESMRGSGPMESFYHKKTLSRARSGNPFRLIVPNTAILWAGPYLSDLAYHLRAKNGLVIIPSAGGAFLELAGKPLEAVATEPMPSEATREPADSDTRVSEVSIRLRDVAGYAEVGRLIDQLIIWPEKNRLFLRSTSRSSGVLFFGPPGCGKSRWAMAIAGELEQEVRLLAPSDLTGPYIGWGQILIREQFNWLAENDKRMLIIDELDAVARSRRESQMHSNEQACVNELLVQIDRVLRLSRLLVATTNFIGSMDDAVLRSGRFGRFIPVPPPDFDESVDILDFYLSRLVGLSGSEDKVRVQTPDRHVVARILEPLYSETVQKGSFFCGADLEEAVNRTYLRSARRAMPDQGWSQETEFVEVHLSEDELNRSLNEVARSVQPEAVDQFVKDVDRHCDREIARSISRRLRLTSAT
jgi:AAA+ superfamily predicted ATPase